MSSELTSSAAVLADCQLCPPVPDVLRQCRLLRQVSSYLTLLMSARIDGSCCSFDPDSKIPVVGAVFAPILGGLHQTNATGTLYSAAQGHGSWSTPISFPLDPSVLSRPSATPAANYKLPQPFHHSVPLPYLPPQPIPADAPKGCLFLAEWGKARSDSPTSNLTKKVNTLWNFAAEVGGRNGKGGMVHGVRSLGSAALDMVYVATGAIDIFWEAGCWEWASLFPPVIGRP